MVPMSSLPGMNLVGRDERRRLEREGRMTRRKNSSSSAARSSSLISSPTAEDSRLRVAASQETTG